jgi:DNA-binding GntR family transcriptional regulator
MEMVIREHLIILDAMRKRDGKAAEAAMRKHLGMLLPDLVNMQAQNPDYFV